jgi:hypothetical protein
MQRFNSIASNVNLFLAVLLSFLFLFENKIALPAPMINLGRMHAMILHLPIGILMLFILFQFIKNNIEKESFLKIEKWILNIAAFTALSSALLGLFLSTEKGSYTPEDIYGHKLSGFLFSIALYAFTGLYSMMSSGLKYFGMGALGLLILFAGHKGAEITHGVDYLFPNEKSVIEKVVDVNASTYEKHIFPILEQKCVSCHTPQKSKGGLVMVDTTSIKKGGKNGPIFIAFNASISTMIKYINLPLDDKLHMSPKGKSQLTDDEIKMLTAWVNAGASFSTKDKDYNDTTDFKKLILKNSIVSTVQKTYNFEAVNQATLLDLTNANRNVRALYDGSPAVACNYILAAGFDPKSINDLSKVKDQLVHLNLSAMPITNDQLGLVNDYVSLEKLILNNTKISSLAKLNKLKNLEEISLINTLVQDEVSLGIGQFPKLKSIFLSGTKLPESSLKNLQSKYPKIKFDQGFKSIELLTLSPPILKNKNSVIGQEGIKLMHHINGVKIRYTLDGSDVTANSKEYTGPIKVDSIIRLQARAFAEGWMQSDSIDLFLFKEGLKIADADLLLPVDEKYKGDGKQNLLDGKRGNIDNTADPLFLGFKENPFLATFQLKENKEIRKIIVGYGSKVYFYVFPPREIEVYGGEDVANWKLIKKVKYNPLAEKDKKDNIEVNAYKIIDIPPSKYKYYKVGATNETKLPTWHQGKGEKAWLFIDEVFFF